jgi:hypothetical protein
VGFVERQGTTAMAGVSCPGSRGGNVFDDHTNDNILETAARRPSTPFGVHRTWLGSVPPTQDVQIEFPVLGNVPDGVVGDG